MSLSYLKPIAQPIRSKFLPWLMKTTWVFFQVPEYRQLFPTLGPLPILFFLPRILSAYLFMCLTPHSLEHHLCVTSSIVLLWPDSFWVLCFRTLLLSFICTLTFSLSLIIYSSPLSTLPLPWRLSLWIASVNSCLLDSENPAEKS